MSAQDHQQPRQRDPLIGDSDETETNTSSRDGGGSTSTLQLLEDVSHAQAMENLLRNERYADIQLQSSDGVMIHANRAMLAARSPMFDRMLYGNFAERTSETVVVSYTKGAILQAIVQYIYRDDLKKKKTNLFLGSFNSLRIYTFNNYSPRIVLTQ